MVAIFLLVILVPLVLAIVIDNLPYSFALILISELALLSIFPTEQRWAKWKGEDGELTS